MTLASNTRLKTVRATQSVVSTGETAIIGPKANSRGRSGKRSELVVEAAARQPPCDRIVGRLQVHDDRGAFLEVVGDLAGLVEPLRLGLVDRARGRHGGT